MRRFSLDAAAAGAPALVGELPEPFWQELVIARAIPIQGGGFVVWYADHNGKLWVQSIDGRGTVGRPKEIHVLDPQLRHRLEAFVSGDGKAALWVTSFAYKAAAAGASAGYQEVSRTMLVNFP